MSVLAAAVAVIGTAAIGLGVSLLLKSNQTATEAAVEADRNASVQPSLRIGRGWNDR
jgi:hypothetical protein